MEMKFVRKSYDSKFTIIDEKTEKRWYIDGTSNVGRGVFFTDNFRRDTEIHPNDRKRGIIMFEQRT